MLQKKTKTFIASGDLSAKEGYAIKYTGAMSGNNAVGIIAGSNDFCAGIISEGDTTGKPVVAVIFGKTEAKLGVGGATVGDLLVADASGTLITQPDTGDNNIIAIAEKTGVEGDIIPVEVFHTLG